ncbi:MAG: hypothetical protein U9R14_00025 [Patescibacteria group bacterium]|nr:hypothetical protein [Patescibacteria group bacterium]
MNSLNTKKIIIFFIVILIAFFVASQAVMADEYGLDKTAEKGYDVDQITGSAIPTDVSVTIGKVIGAGLAFIGILFFILMIYGGIIWMMARGNEQEVEKAKDLIYAAVIGLIIVLAAYAITAYIGGALTT